MMAVQMLEFGPVARRLLISHPAEPVYLVVNDGASLAFDDLAQFDAWYAALDAAAVAARLARPHPSLAEVLATWEHRPVERFGVYGHDPKPEEERFAAAVVEAPNGCWMWTGYSDGRDERHRYGQMNNRKKVVKAHQWSYERLIGPIPDGLQLDHLCRTTLCVNPWHLQPVTRHRNIIRSDSPAAVNARKTHCVNGHEFTPENTRAFIDKHGKPHRQCKACKRAGDAAARARKRAEREQADPWVPRVVES